MKATNADWCVTRLSLSSMLKTLRSRAVVVQVPAHYLHVLAAARPGTRLRGMSEDLMQRFGTEVVLELLRDEIRRVQSMGGDGY